MHVTCAARVFTGGKDFICWDPRQGLFGHKPAFKVDYYLEAGRRSSSVTALTSEESTGQPYMLTGVSFTTLPHAQKAWSCDITGLFDSWGPYKNLRLCCHRHVIPFSVPLLCQEILHCESMKARAEYMLFCGTCRVQVGEYAR